MAPSSLWKSALVGDWEAAWASYEGVVDAQQKDRLVELDTWIRTELPATLHARDPSAFITQPELEKLMEWKLKKGKWRPQLMKFVKDLSDKQVKDASTKSLKELNQGHVKAAVEALAALKGIGPATASAVLAAYDESVPFMGDEALEAIASIIGPRKYTLPHYLSFHEELTKKAKWLAKEAKNDGKNGEEWTAQRVQLCLYAEANSAVSKAPAKSAKATPSKRKATTPEKTEAEETVEEKTAGEDTTSTGRRTRRKTDRYVA